MSIEFNKPVAFPQIKAQGSLNARPNQLIDGLVIPYYDSFGNDWSDFEVPDMSDVSFEQAQMLAVNLSNDADPPARFCLWTDACGNDAGEWFYTDLERM